MKIIEVRDGFITFEADESVYLSSFIQAGGADKDYIAQVNQIRKVGEVRIANAKILFIQKDGVLNNYDKTQPSKDAQIRTYTLEILRNSINAKRPVIAGKLLDNSGNVVLDSSAFDKKMLIIADNPESNNILTGNFAKQFQNAGINTVVIDTSGVIKSKKYTAGVDFKLPLNTKILKFMYKTCLNDATSDSKSVIAEIFRDLSEYSESVPFVPFGTLKAIVDDMVDNQHILKLFVLKNKLAGLGRLGYFADNKDEVENLRKILASGGAVLDLSKLDSVFKNCYLEYIYSVLENSEYQVFLELSSSVSKKNLKLVLSDSSVSTALITNSKYQYINDIKGMFDNFIIEPSNSNNEMFRIYSSFFGSMEKGMYLIAGEAINYIPVVSLIQEIDEVLPCYLEKQEETEDYADNDTEEYSDEKDSDDILDIDAKEDECTEEDYEENDDNETEDDEEESEDSEDKFVVENSEIIAAIEEKSENVINSVAQSLEEDSHEIELFDEDDEDDDEEDEEELISEYDSEDDVIEPEFREADDSEDLTPEDTDFGLLEEDSTEIQDDNTEISDDNLDELGSSEEEFADELAEIGDSDSLVEVEDSNVDGDIEEGLLEDNNEEISLAAGDSFEEDGIMSELSDSDNLAIQLEDNEDELIQELQMSDEQNSEPEFSEDIASGLEDIDVIGLDEDDDQGLEEIVELDPDSAGDDDIIIDISDDSENINIDEEIDQQIVADVDKVYTTMKDTEDLEEISDSDLDFIDELNSDDEDSLSEYTEDLQEYSDSGIDDGILEQPSEGIIPERQSAKDNNSEILEKREANTPIVPVYDADIPQEDMVISDPIQQGDSVVHAKYGNGVVEKMIKYGTKTLFSINFENIGRRLLDPTLTEIKKL